MAVEQGNLSINSENIFPIIKKWLYSDHDIFIRELVSNGCDAITKLKKLELIGEANIPEGHKFSIQVEANAEAKTISFTDNGIGMTDEEVKEYINQIAFSGATDFLEKYKDKTNEEQIIGHFGLGFYSAFMVADKVTIDTLSYKEGAKAVHWESEGGTEFSMDEGEKAEVGTKITLYLNEDSYEFSNEYRVREVLQKYCGFMPVEIFFTKANGEQEYETIDKEDLREDDVLVETIIEEAKTEEVEKENGEKEVVEVSPRKEKAKINKRPVSLSDTNPLWNKHPNECTEEEYKSFYRKVFQDYKEPLFWIHLNMDYPFNLKGILYFPKINIEYENAEGVIKLYNNQVFIADNIKEVIPEFLLLLKGVIDCPDLPLNVSRSALQNDGFVKKISDYITKKVADKLSGMYKVERENYEKYWDDISPFIKYGCLKDDKFRDKMKDFIIFKNLENKYLTLPEYVEASKNKAENAEVKAAEADGTLEVEAAEADGAVEAEAAEANEAVEAEVVDADGTSETENADAAGTSEAEVVNADGTPAAETADEEKDDEEAKTTIYYVTDVQQQSQYINMFKEEGIDALILTHNIDQPFITQLEQGDDKIHFQRIDADLTDSFKEEVDEDALKEKTGVLTEVFKKALGKDNLTVKVEQLKNENVSSMITLSEESRRMQDMMKMYSMPGMDPNMFGMGMSGETLILNANNALVKYVLDNKDGENVTAFCQQLYDLAALAQRPLSSEEMTKFIARSNEIMLLLAK